MAPPSRRAGDAGWPRVVWASVTRTATGSGRETRHPASPRSFARQPDHGGVSPLGSWAGGGKAGLFMPGPLWNSAHPFQGGAHFSCRWLRSSIPTDLTARSHRPRAVEHRDCPPCGGDGGIITQVRGGGDGGFSIPQLAGVSGLIGLGLGILDSTEVRSISRCHPGRAEREPGSIERVSCWRNGSRIALRASGMTGCGWGPWVPAHALCAWPE